MILFYFRPQRRVWVQHGANFKIDELVTTTSIDTSKKDDKKKKEKKKPSMDELAGILDNRGLSND